MPVPRPPRLSLKLFGFITGEADGLAAILVLAVVVVVALVLRFPPWR